jgi:DNA-binding transcriptional MerR regulator
LTLSYFSRILAAGWTVNDGKPNSLSLAELAEVSGVPARSIRFYIARGLLAGPATAGRGAAYGAEHLERLAAIRRLQGEGRTLAEIARALEGPETEEALVQPDAWWSYAVAPDVNVWVRAGSSPWRLRQIRRAIEHLRTELRHGEDHHE